MAGALFAGFQQEVVVIFVEGLDDLLDGMPSSRREWVKLRVATQDDCWLDFVRTGSGDTPSEKLGSGLSIKPTVRLKISVQAALGGPATRIAAVPEPSSPLGTSTRVKSAIPGWRSEPFLPAPLLRDEART